MYQFMFQEQFDKSKLSDAQREVSKYMREIKNILEFGRDDKDNDKATCKFPKFHYLKHVFPMIMEFGSARNFDGGPNESHHKYIAKAPGNRTQGRDDTFDEQTCYNISAQIMLDQFISCAEDKWKVMSGLVMLLPHGYEGQGAEHSSARLERYLQMCAKYNMQIVNCTTPANFYHVMRRQLKREYRKPLVVFTPKSLLRHPKCVSSITDLADGKFEGIIDDTIAPKSVDRLVLCSGKIYYELLDRREKEAAENVALVRVEQLFPLDKQGIIELVEKYNAKELVWVQEEPENMGAWTFILSELRTFGIDVIAREASAATATGSSKTSAAEQNELINKVFKK